MEQHTGARKKFSFSSTVRALGHRNFRLFFAGQSVSLIGTWMQRIALAWLVYRLTDSAFLLGLVGFSGQIPTSILAPFAGVLIDRWSRHHILLFTQVMSMIQASILFLLVFSGLIQIWHIIALSIMLGLINAFDMPTRQSFLIEMVGDRQDLGNAIALNSIMVNAARLLGPSTAGILIALVGEQTCFLVNALSYAAVILSLSIMNIEKKDRAARHKKVLQELAEGFRYVRNFIPIRDILMMFALVNLVGMPYTVLMPVFARDVLTGGADSMGFLMGSVGMGAMFGAVSLASRKNVLGLGKMIPIGASVFGTALMVFSFSHNLVVGMIIMLFTGFGQMNIMATSNTLLQTMVAHDKRGRVMSFYTMAFMGATPIGSLIAGVSATHIGASWTVFGGGIICLLGAAVFAKRLPMLRDLVRPVYIEKGIINEINTGIQQANELSLHRR